MKLAVLTSGRQDWGILRSTCVALRAHPTLSLSLWSGGMHESPAFGATAKDLEADGFVLDARLPWLDDAATPAAEQSARALRAVAGALEQHRPDALVLVGDRFETAAAALAATLAAVPLVHLHGGEETEGAFDNALRHAITKLAHLHFVSHERHAARVRAMGEDPASIHVVGAPGLDNLHRADLPSRDQLAHELGVELRAPVVLVTLHPSTLGGDPAEEARAVVSAMDAVPATYIITMPNADPGATAIRDILREAGQRPGRVVVEALGERRYWGLLRVADAMLGNSSSALVEAPAVHLPAVNVGDRQRGRERGANVVDAPAEPAALSAALRQALSGEVRRASERAGAPFGDGQSAARIVDILSRWQPPRPPRKRFFETSTR